MMLTLEVLNEGGGLGLPPRISGALTHYGY